jgi:hypothetical protein
MLVDYVGRQLESSGRVVVIVVRRVGARARVILACLFMYLGGGGPSQVLARCD